MKVGRVNSRLIFVGWFGLHCAFLGWRLVGGGRCSRAVFGDAGSPPTVDQDVVQDPRSLLVVAVTSLVMDSFTREP